MNAHNAQETMTWIPLATGSREHARATRVEVLKARVAAGEYRLDARAVAEALAEAGAFRAERSGSEGLETQADMQRAMHRFVVAPAALTPDPGRRLQLVTAG